MGFGAIDLIWGLALIVVSNRQGGKMRVALFGHLSPGIKVMPQFIWTVWQQHANENGGEEPMCQLTQK